MLTHTRNRFQLEGLGNDVYCFDVTNQRMASAGSDGKIMLHNKALPKDCYKVSIDKSLVDATFIPDVGSNGCTTVLDAVGGFVSWPKNQVVLDPKATPPCPLQMITLV
ncbi:hypothetical protein Tco_1522301 [Tanacetum coccineum]